MAQQAPRSVTLAGQSKLGETSRVQSLAVETINMLVTNRTASAEQIAALRQTGIKVEV
ncbi:MAG TPA: hypothetical protein VJ906_07510 [Roseovarius sp.]|nr:hypothetical protein [Roseovarius sp.]